MFRDHKDGVHPSSREHAWTAALWLLLGLGKTNIGGLFAYLLS